MLPHRSPEPLPRVAHSALGVPPRVRYISLGGMALALVGGALLPTRSQTSRFPSPTVVPATMHAHPPPPYHASQGLAPGTAAFFAPQRHPPPYPRCRCTHHLALPHPTEGTSYSTRTRMHTRKTHTRTHTLARTRAPPMPSRPSRRANDSARLALATRLQAEPPRQESARIQPFPLRPRRLGRLLKLLTLAHQ